MSTLGTYSFLPWLRQGLANQIQSPDFDNSVTLRPTIAVELALTGNSLAGGTAMLPLEHEVALFGPGDIIGLDRRAIVRTEPRDWITNFEPNYLAHVEFYDEDFPWRYTPAAPDLTKGRLRPWITLLVLADGEFTDGRNLQDKPLPFIDVTDPAAFPRADELWAWAHVHVNRSLAASDLEFRSTAMDTVIPRLEAVLRENPDLAYSRLVSPRKLAQNTAYHAFIIPTFEVGRRAGLNLDLENIPATMSAWDPGPRPQATSYPYYHRWFFRTGATGDFESLVRLLKPGPVNPKVGTREMDVQFPDVNVRPLDKPELGGILKLGGALRPPSKVPPDPDPFETWDDPFPRPLQEDLAHLVNLADDYQRLGDPDPIIAPPLYGGWHSLTKRLLRDENGVLVAEAQNWVHRLNLDPRFRVAAGIGTGVIQDQQERLMDAAWGQIGDVLKAQRGIRLGQLGIQVSRIWYDLHMRPMLGVSQQKALLLMAPLNKRILSSGVTVHYAQRTALVQPAMTSAVLRRIARPRGRLIRSLPFTAARTPDQLLARANSSSLPENSGVTATPPKVTPAPLVTPAAVAKVVLPADAPPAVLTWLRATPALPWIILVLAVVLALLLLLWSPSALGLLAAAAVVAAGIAVQRRLAGWSSAARASEAIQESSQTPAAVDAMPGAAGFRIAEPGSFTTPEPGADSVEARRFKEALRGTFDLIQASATAGVAPVKQPLDLTRIANDAIVALNPSVTIPRRILTGIFIPPRIRGDMPEGFVEPMAYPVIDLPMYEPLKDRSAELFLPNINLIENNSITLLETNQRFIESYMVGLNHEFARELLWREFPTDQRGSTFRQFWDVRGFFNTENLDDEALKEKLRDIPPIHRWSKRSALGEHDNREVGGANEEELVLVIRGELLKRYPTAVIYAHRACWQKVGDGTPADSAKDPCLRAGGIDNTQERRLIPLTPAEESQPPTSKIRTPLYEAKVDPDIYFFGFDLTVEAAKGGTGENPNDDPGWFFVIKERPGEPRFGLDDEAQPVLNVWNDLSWPDVQPAAPGSHIEIATAPAAFPLLAPSGAEQEKAEQYAEDKKVAWSRDMSSAELAYILFQAPVLVGVHASEMLPK